MSYETFLGIDPGKEGAMVLLSAEGKVLGSRKLDTVKEKGERKEYNLQALVSAFNTIHSQFPNTLVCLEHLHAIPGLGCLAGFMRGYSMGILEMALTQLDWGYKKVTPAVWKKEMIGIPGADKSVSILKAAELFPDSIHIFEKKRKGYDDNIAEALLIAEWARRKFI